MCDWEESDYAEYLLWKQVGEVRALVRGELHAREPRARAEQPVPLEPTAATA
jgi:hypothetical protein